MKRTAKHTTETIASILAASSQPSSRRPRSRAAGRAEREPPNLIHGPAPHASAGLTRRCENALSNCRIRVASPASTRPSA